jgi:nucleotidyltransferase substrate binding protein (TIGR01987 family)
MTIDTQYFERCIKTLRNAHDLLLKADRESIEYDMYRSACVKEFEIILEQSGKLLRKILKPYFHSSKEVDKLFFKEIFRHAVLRSLLSDESCSRWCEYRDNRNNTAHDYGENFAEDTLVLLPQFIADAQELSEIIQQNAHVSED